MAKNYRKKNNKQSNFIYTVITIILICAVFLSLVSSFYYQAEQEAYEMLHIQTKQIKDDLTLQIKSDRENLITMANFAAKLYSDGESYDIMFESFKPIGLFSNIGILNSENLFITKKGTVDLNGKISFDDEAERGEYISGRIPDLTRDGEEIIRSAVPIVSDGKTVGILYGVVKLKTIGEKYKNMAKELDAQLFVYDRESGKFVIDTISDNPGELSEFKNRKYNDGYSYEELISTDKGYTSFESIFIDETLYAHYSTIEDFDWGIMLGRYESQVFAKTHEISKLLTISFVITMLIVVAYLSLVIGMEKRRMSVTVQASTIRKMLLEINQQKTGLLDALRKLQEYSMSRSAFFADTDGEDNRYVLPALKDVALSGEPRKYFMSQLFRYAASYYSINQSTVGFICIKPNRYLMKTNQELYLFMTEHKIKNVSFATITDKNNHVSILGTVNPKKKFVTRNVLEDTAVCFSIAIYNKNHLNKTETAAITDSLTGVHNRVSYKRDIIKFDEQKPEDFSCIYVDVNELHLRNNKYGHAAGDEMLIYIANTLKEVFYGHNIYRMGGDEFLVFVKELTNEQVKSNIETFIERLNAENYNVAIGVSYRKKCTNCEEMVRESEIRMYEAKAQYYQKKEQKSVSNDTNKNFVQVKTGIKEIDTILSVLKEHYNGIYRVNLSSDCAHRILMPSYLGYKEDEENFSKLLSKYIYDSVNSDFHRALLSFQNYDVIKRQIADGIVPGITFKKNNGEMVTLRVYSLDTDIENADETLWVFSKS